MESPVVVDKPPEYHRNVKDNGRGFPFDEEEGSGAWSELASRHPDIAARLRQRPATWARKRRPSSQDATDDFGDGFGGFDRFPFDDIPPEFREHFPTHWNRRFGAQSEPQTQAQQPPPQPHSSQHQTAATQTEESPGPSSHPQQTHLPQYGLRNTIDLGQKSPADPSLVDAEERNQRSMSAPPDSCTADQINAPKMNNQNHQEQAHHPQHSDHPPQTSNVRHIPIFVEGRDEPVINKSVDHGAHFSETKPAYASSPPQQQPHIDREQYFADEPVFHPPPNFSRAFGTPFNKGFRQGPQPFVQQKVYPQTAFTRGASPQRSQSPKQQMHPEEHFVKVPVHHEHAAPKPEPPKPQQKQAPQQQQPQQQVPSQQQVPQQQQQVPPKQQTPPPQQQATSNDPITQILSIQTDVLNLMTDVENFTGSKKDKKYLFLDEMLTRNLIKLDNIETDGKENIRQARREAIKCIQKCIAVLEAKADKGGSAPQTQDVEMKENTETSDEQPVTENGVEVEMKDSPNSEAKVGAHPEEQQAAPLNEEKHPEPKIQQETSEIKEMTQPETADTRPEDNKDSEQNFECIENKKNAESVDKKANPKKGTKNVKKRDKSKDKKEISKDNKEQTVVEQKLDAKAEVMQVDDKGDKSNTQAMEVDGAASQQI